MFCSTAKHIALKTLLAALLVSAALAHGTDMAPEAKAPEAKTQLQVTAMGSVQLVKRKGSDGSAQLELLVPITFKPSPGCRIVAAQRVAGEIEVVYRDARAKAVQNPGRYTYTIADPLKWLLTERTAIDAEVTIYFRLSAQKVIDTPGYVWQAEYNLTKQVTIEVSETDEPADSGNVALKAARTSIVEMSDAGVKVAAK